MRFFIFENCKKNNKSINKNIILFIAFLFILVLGLTVRIVNICQNDFVFGYDEVEDLIHVKRIVNNHDLIVIGKAIYGNPNIRHGVLSYYFMTPGFLLFGQNPLSIALWNTFLSLSTIIIIFILSKSIFKDLRLSFIASSLYAFSYLAVEYSAWVSHPTFAPLFTSIFFLGLWKIFEKKDWGFLLSSVFLALAIQTNLLFLYLFPIFIISLIIFRPKIPSLKIIILSLLTFILSISTIIYTEINFKFSGVKTILHFSNSFDEGKTSIYERCILFGNKFLETISFGIVPKNTNVTLFLGIFIIFIIVIFFLKSKKLDRYKILFLLIYLFSPSITLLLGYHNKPWTFLGILPAISLAIAFVVSKLKNNIFILLSVFIIIFFNVRGIILNKINDTIFTSLPDSSYLTSQLNVVDYTYESSNMKPFSINAVTYPLYVNTYWSYHYPWYGMNKYGYEPTWSGSMQLYPYNSLRESDGKEDFIYLIIDNSPDIPLWAKEQAIKTLNEKSYVLEEIEIGGYIVQKRKSQF